MHVEFERKSMIFALPFYTAHRVKRLQNACKRIFMWRFLFFKMNKPSVVHVRACVEIFFNYQLPKLLLLGKASRSLVPYRLELSRTFNYQTRAIR